MNEHLTERFGRASAFREPFISSQPSERLEMTLNRGIRSYAQANRVYNPDDWTSLPEIPDATELFDAGRTGHDSAIELEDNIIVGPTTREDYLQRHYRLLREDAIAPLRDSV